MQNTKMESNKKMESLKTIVLSALLAATVNTTIPTAAHASIVSDPVTYSRLMQQRRILKSKEFDLLRDKDELLRQMDDLKKQDEQTPSYVLNDLSESLEQTYNALRKTQTDIRDVNRQLL